jgi:two-component system sensor histidine kinase KdpD
LPAEDLIERLQAGKVYPADRVAQAQSNFFTPQNLTRLREMALSESANFLDRRQRADEPSGQDHGPGGGMGQVAVALSSGGPDPGAILRKAARLASQLNAPWYAVYVRTPGEAPRVITAEAQRVIGETLEAAQRMGGVVIVLKREQVAAALVDFVREYGITHLVVGRPVAPRGWLRWQATLLEVLLRELKSVDVVVV